MKKCIAYLIYLLIFVKSTDKELSISSENNTSQMVTTDSSPELSSNNSMSSLNLCQPNQNIISDECSQDSLPREKLFNNDNNVTSNADNSIVSPLIKNNSTSENLNENIRKVKLCDRENKKYSESNLIPQTSSNNPSSSNSVKNNYTLITYKDIKNYSKNWNFKNIQKMHSVDLKINSKIYSKKFNKPITKETFFSRASIILINQINYHKNYGKVKYTYNILNLIINEFNNDYKNASLFIIFLTFTTKGLKHYVVNHNTYCIEHLFQISLMNFIFSDVSIKNTIKIWKKFNFKYFDIKTGYNILVSVGLYFYFVDGNENVNCFVYSYKKFVKESLERIFWESIQVY